MFNLKKLSPIGFHGQPVSGPQSTPLFAKLQLQSLKGD